jgi:ribonucleoside-triphosphate reductase
MARANHLNNEIYIHDLDHYAVGDHNCLSVPLDELLANGFNTRQTDVRPAGSVNTAFQLVAVLFQL